MAARERTRFPGVYSRKSEARMFRGKPDVGFDLTFKAGGRKVWEKVGWRSEGITAAYASQIRAERMRALRLGSLQLDSLKQYTFDQAFEKYREGHLSQLKSGNRVVRLYEARLREPFGKRKLSSITPLLLEQFKRDLLAEGLSPATVTHCLGTIRSVFRKMKDWDLYAGDIPTEKIAMPKGDNKRTRFLSREEADLLLDALRRSGSDTYRIALISLHTGMRFGEIAGLRGEHVDLAEGTLRIADPKNGQARTAFMTEAVRDVFRQVPLKAGQYVFPARGGGRRQDVSDAFARCVKRLGLNRGRKDRRDKVVFHTLRHTYASWLVQQGVPLYTVGELLGHSTLEMTKRYSHLAPGNLRATVGVLEGWLVGD